jgi:hypothetical protein
MTYIYIDTLRLTKKPLGGTLFQNLFFSEFYTILFGDDICCACSRYEGEMFVQYFDGET